MVKGNPQSDLTKSLVALESQSKEEVVQFFVDFCKKYGMEKSPLFKRKNSSYVTDLNKAFKAMEEKERAKVWKNLNKITYHVVETCCGEENEVNSISLEFLEGMIVACLACADLDPIPDDLNLILVLLHGFLLEFERVLPALACDVAVMCCECWLHNNHHKHILCNPLIFFLNSLLQNDEPNKKMIANLAAFKYIYLMREVCAGLLLTDDNSLDSADELNAERVEELCELVVEASCCDFVLSNQHGKKFVATSLARSGREVMKRVHKAIVSHLNRQPAHFNMDQLGQMYHQAWMFAEDDDKKFFEDDCLQDLMYRAIRTPRARNHSQKSPFSEMQTLLNALLQHKTSIQLQHMTSRLYEPFIWRCLQAANPMVRANALTLLFDSFPLQQEGVSVMEQENFLQKQTKAISNCLLDPNPQVRVIALNGMFKILHLFWEILASCNLGQIFKDIYGKLAFDVASDEVRESVLVGSKLLLKNHYSHEVMKKLLPNLKSCVNDACERVRVAFGELLLQVQSTTTIMFWDVCPVEDIFRQIEFDKPTVCKRLNQLLIPSFFPTAKNCSTWVVRCMNFYTKTGTGARKFYFHVASSHDLPSIGSFIKTINRFVFHNVKRSLTAAMASGGGGGEDDVDDDDEKDADSDEKENNANKDESSGSSSVGKIVDDPDKIAGLLETIAIMWPCYLSRIKAELRENENGDDSNEKEMIKTTLDEISKTVRICFRKFSTNRMHHVLIELASVLDPTIIKSFSRTVIPKLRSLDRQATRDYYSMLIRCASRWKWGNEVLELVLEWLQASLHQHNDKSGRRSGGSEKRKKKQVMFAQVPNESRPDQAIRYLTCFIQDMDLSSGKVKANVQTLESISECLYVAVTEIGFRFNNDARLDVGVWSDQMLIDALHLNLQINNDLYVMLRKRSDKEGSSSYDAKMAKVVTNIEKTIEQVAQVVDANTNHFDRTMNTSMQDRRRASDVLRRTSTSKQLVAVLLENLMSAVKCEIPIMQELVDFVASLTSKRSLTEKHLASVCSTFHETVQAHCLFEWSQQPLQDQQQLKNIDSLTTIFENVLSYMLISSHQSSDSFLPIMKEEVRKKLRVSLKLICDLSKDLPPLRQFYDKLCTKILEQVVLDLNRMTNRMSFEEESVNEDELKLETFDDLPPFSEHLLPLICTNNHQVEHVVAIVVSLPDDDDDAKSSRSRRALVKMLQLLLESSPKKKQRAAVEEKTSKAKKRIHNDEGDLTVGDF